MEDYNKLTKPDIENTNTDIFSESVSNENRELFRRALSDAMDLKIRKIEEEINDVELPPPSKRYKIRMNRIFRERVGGNFLPYPEADNFYEKVRSKVIVKLKINEVLDGCKTRKKQR